MSLSDDTSSGVEANPNAWGMVADYLGVEADEVRSAVKSGAAIPFETFRETLHLKQWATDPLSLMKFWKRLW